MMKWIGWLGLYILAGLIVAVIMALVATLKLGKRYGIDTVYEAYKALNLPYSSSGHLKWSYVPINLSLWPYMMPRNVTTVFSELEDICCELLTKEH